MASYLQIYLFSQNSHNETNDNPGQNVPNDQNIRATSELEDQAYERSMNNECYQDDTHENIPISNHHSILSPHQNNLKAVNSPLHRLHSLKEDELSKFEDFQ